MTLFETYIEQVLAEQQEPQIGDEFDFELREQMIVECRIVAKYVNAIVVETNKETDALLESYGIVFEDIKRYGAVGSNRGMGYSLSEGVMSEIAIELGEIADRQDFDALYDLMTSTSPAGQMVQEIANDIAVEHRLYDDDHEELLERVMDYLVDEFGDQLDEAEYQGRDVDLNKPTRGDVKKFKVYVKDPSTGNVKKVNFGDPNMRIKKSDPDRRRSFRARHRCDTAKDKTTARYWSCRKW